MNFEVLLLYSDHSNACDKFKSLMSSLIEYSKNVPELAYIISNTIGLNVDSDKVKAVISKSEKIKVNVVPTLLLIHPDNKIEQYEGKTAFDFINQYSQPQPYQPQQQQPYHPQQQQQQPYHPQQQQPYHPQQQQPYHPQQQPSLLSQNSINHQTSSVQNNYQEHQNHQNQQYSGITSLNVDDSNLDSNNLDINEVNKDEISQLLSLSRQIEHPSPAITENMNVEKMASGKPTKGGMQTMLDQARDMAKSREGSDKPIHTMGEVASRATPTTALQIPSNLTDLSGMN